MIFTVDDLAMEAIYVGCFLVIAIWTGWLAFFALAFGIAGDFVWQCHRTAASSRSEDEEDHQFELVF